jgi:hypothetical protein
MVTFTATPKSLLSPVINDLTLRSIPERRLSKNSRALFFEGFRAFFLAIARYEKVIGSLIVHKHNVRTKVLQLSRNVRICIAPGQAFTFGRLSVERSLCTQGYYKGSCTS